MILRNVIAKSVSIPAGLEVPSQVGGTFVTGGHNMSVLSCGHLIADSKKPLRSRPCHICEREQKSEAA